MAIAVDIAIEPGAGTAPSRAQLRRWLAPVAAEFALADCELAVRVVGEAEGAALNQRWRGRSGATNVLSFPAGSMPELPGQPRHLGDLVLCAPVLRREAAAQGKPEASHWAHLLVHGTLHLLGLDHETAAEAEAMEALEVRLLATLGIPDPYATDQAPAAAL